MKTFVKIISDDVRFARMLELEMADCGIKTAPEHYEPDSKLYILADLELVKPSELSEYSQAEIIGFCNSKTVPDSKTAELCSAILHRPFHTGELLSLINTDGIEKRTKKQSLRKRAEILTADDLSRSALYGDIRIDLSEHEYELLKLLCKKRGTAVSREEISELLEAEEGNMGDVYICHLRRKIDNKLGLKLIYTVRGKGYMLK